MIPLALLACALALSFPQAPDPTGWIPDRDQGASPAQARPAEESARLLERLRAACPAPNAALRLVYEGSYALEAHLAKPHDVLRLGTRLCFTAGANGCARLDWETWPLGHEEQRDLDTTIVRGERVWQRSAAAKPFLEKRGRAAAILRERVEAGLPWRLLARAAATAQRCRSLAPGVLEYREDEPFGALARQIAAGAEDAHVSSITRRFAHPRLGDALEELDYGSWATRDGLELPGTITLRELDGANLLTTSPGTFELHLVRCEPAAQPGNELEAPVDAPLDESGPPVAGGITIEELAPGVFSFLARELEGRSLAVEFDDHLLVIDAPLSSALGERMVDALRERFPGKPVRWILFSHFHPHYTGGLRAFLAAGATVVAPPSGAQFAAEIAARPFTLEPDAWARAAREPAIESFRGERVFEDAHQRLVAVDIGKRSAHTDEYLLFALPRQRLLLVDDVGWFAKSDGKPRFGAGSRGVLAAIEEHGLDVDTLWQSWPVNHARPRITRAELEEGVRALR